MPFVIFDRDRALLPVGESVVGGSGPGSIPIPRLTRLSPLAVIWVGPDRLASIRRIGSMAVTVNSVAIGEEPVILPHGSQIEFANVQILFGDVPVEGGSLPSIRDADQPRAHASSRHSF